MSAEAGTDELGLSEVTLAVKDASSNNQDVSSK